MQCCSWDNVSSKCVEGEAQKRNATCNARSCPKKKKKYRLRGRSSETAKAHRG
eukprot:TRINITY_DN5214_c0_g2_i1.p2 TRINITY_DN5214_c0_g2~~TRINITY_DN5214_c0_g2_i1.p2  ORF type:complete len:53 (+),score=25.38 TRINITY_DN5214_c0_g2_i1:205-363(+)